MRIAFCWFNISGYMAACWRALAARPDVQVKVIAFAPDTTGIAPFRSDLLAGVDHVLLDHATRNDAELIAKHVADHRPDGVVVSGWAHPPYLRLLHDARFERARFAMAMDTPWTGSWRQRLGRFKIARHAARFDRVLVTGERSFQLARQLGFAERQIRRGVYGFDDAAFAAADAARRSAGAHPKRFLFTGSLDERKGVDLLLAGHAQYRAAVTDPWPLSICGAGPLAGAVAAAGPLVEHLGFVQPADQPAVYARHGAFVLASRYDPWPLVVLEAAGAALPVLCSEACGSSVELVRQHYSGMTFGTGDAGEVARAMRWAHERYDQLPDIGRRGRELALAYAAPVWAERIRRLWDE